jgi:hypothetical protein
VLLVLLGRQEKPVLLATLAQLVKLALLDLLDQVGLLAQPAKPE